MKIAILPGDGIGPEIVKSAVQILNHLDEKFEIEQELIGGAAYDIYRNPLPENALKLAKEADAILFGAVGGPQYDQLEFSLRPEQAILGLRKQLNLFANLRPVFLYPELIKASPLKSKIISGLNILIVRELTGDVYFGKPRGIRNVLEGPFKGDSEGFDTMCYSENEIRRIARIAFEAARDRKKKLISVDKANVLATSRLWRKIVTELHRDYLDVRLEHMYIDNAAMQLICTPLKFDVIVTGNMFGDILSDIAAVLTGSIGMLPSGSLNINHKGLYEPSHGSAPDIAGKNIANPLAMILSIAMMLRYSFNKLEQAMRIEYAVKQVLAQGLRTLDIMSPGTSQVSTTEMSLAVIKALN